MYLQHFTTVSLNLHSSNATIWLKEPKSTYTLVRFWFTFLGSQRLPLACPLSKFGTRTTQMLFGAAIAIVFAATASASNAFAANELLANIEIVPTKPLATSLTSETLNNLNDTIAGTIETAKQAIFNKCKIQASLFRAQVNLAQAWTLEPPEPSVLSENLRIVRAKIEQCKQEKKSIDIVAHESIDSIQKAADRLEKEYLRVLYDSIEGSNVNANDVRHILLTEMKLAKENLTFYNVEYQSLTVSAKYVETSMKFLISMFEVEQSQAVTLYSKNEWHEVAESKLAILNKLCSLIEKTVPKLANVEVEAQVAKMRYNACKDRIDVLNGLAVIEALRFKTTS